MKKTVLAALLATLATTAMADINVGVTLSATGPAASLGIPERTPSTCCRRLSPARR